MNFLKTIVMTKLVEQGTLYYLYIYLHIMTQYKSSHIYNKQPFHQLYKQLFLLFFTMFLGLYIILTSWRLKMTVSPITIGHTRLILSNCDFAVKVSYFVQPDLQSFFLSWYIFVSNAYLVVKSKGFTFNFNIISIKVLIERILKRKLIIN